MNIELYNVGGAVRDRFLGRKSKDIDISVEADSWEDVKRWCDRTMTKVYQVKDEFLTVKGRLDGEDLDIVMCRKEGYYSDGRRPDDVEPGTLFDDLSRRDFTINALAVSYTPHFNNLHLDDLKVIDYFGGLKDLELRIIRCVGDPAKRFGEDPLRILRAFRFSIVLGFEIDDAIVPFLHNSDWVQRIIKTVKPDRIREELMKCFRYDTRATLQTFARYPKMVELFEDSHSEGYHPLWLIPTTRGR